jgi:hypothetical protein
MISIRLSIGCALYHKGVGAVSTLRGIDREVAERLNDHLARMIPNGHKREVILQTGSEICCFADLAVSNLLY